MSWAWRAAVSASSEAHDDHLLTAETAATRPATHPAVQARYLLCNVVPQSVVLDRPRVKRSIRSELGLSAGALAMLAPRPAAGPALAFFELLLGPANAALSSHLLLGVLDPADELVARQGRDVLPGSERLELAISAARRSAGSLCTTPPGTRLPLTAASVTPERRSLSRRGGCAAGVGHRLTGEAHASNQSYWPTFEWPISRRPRVSTPTTSD